MPQGALFYGLQPAAHGLETEDGQSHARTWVFLFRQWGQLQHVESRHPWRLSWAVRILARPTYNASANI